MDMNKSKRLISLRKTALIPHIVNQDLEQATEDDLDIVSESDSESNISKEATIKRLETMK